MPCAHGAKACAGNVIERGEVGAHPIAWGHVRMFTPWRMNLGPRSAALLERAGWTRPDPESYPTGAELARRYLEPLARLPQLENRLHLSTQVVHVSRRGLLKGDSIGSPTRKEHPFRSTRRFSLAFRTSASRLASTRPQARPRGPKPSGAAIPGAS